MVGVLIDYDLVTHQINRIIIPDKDSQSINHKLNPGEGRAVMNTTAFALDPITGGGPARSSLRACAQAVLARTGIWPPNIPQ